ncbi:MAG: hypothetical protein Aurels2KO_06250 [Aureliella sp.]
MAFKIALLLAFGAQFAAAIMALRLNFRYRIYSAWFFVSGAALVAAILRLTTLCETWMDPPTFESNWVQWASAFAALCASLMLLGGMSSIEPFFKQMAAAQAALRSEHAMLESYVKETEEELRLAQRIQRQLLPRSVPDFPNLDIYGQSDPAEWTSGDYFDYLTLKGGSLAVVVADVSGHGLGPALLMSSTRASFRGIAPTTDDVGRLLTSGNQAVADAVSESEFVTAMAVQYDATTKSLHYATAGHAGYLVRSDGSCDRLSGDSPPLGILPELEVDTGIRQPVGEGDILVLVTDGILEASNSSESMFGEERLLESVRQNQTESAQSIVRALLAASRNYAGSQPQQDDITAVVVKFAAA